MLKQIVIQNLCQHKNLTLEMGPGLTVVVGRQGSGKTNLVSLALASISGVNRLPGNKEDNVMYGSADKPAFVATTWKIGAREFTVTRGYNKRKSSIIIDGEIRNDIRRETEITDMISSITGVAAANVFRFSFVAQSETDAMFQQKETDRVKFAAELLGLTDSLEWGGRINQLITKLDGTLVVDYKSALQVAVADRRIKWAELLKKRELRQQSLQKLEASEELYKQTEDSRRLYAELLTYRKLASEAAEAVRLAAVELADCMNRINVLTPAIAELRADIGRRELLDKDYAIAAMEPTVLREMRDYDLRIIQLKNLLKEPVKPIETRPLQQAIMDLAAASDIARRDVVLAKSGKKNCDKCGSEIAAYGKDPQALQAEVDKMVVELKELVRVDEQWRDYDLKYKAWDESRVSNTESLQRGELLLEDKREELAKITQAKCNLPVGYKAWFAEAWTSKRNELTKMEAELAVKLARRQQLEDTELKALSLKSTEASEQVRLATLSEDEIAKFSRLGTQVQLDKQAVDVAKQEEIASEREYSRLMGSIDNTVKAYAIQRDTVKAKELAQSVAPLLRATGLPKELLFHQMRAATANITHLCSELGQPFAIDVNENLEFIATWPNGRVEPVTRLSEGQRACAATMFWIAKLLSAKGGLPIMILDEPSAHMDADVVHQFGLMLVSLNQILVQRGLQVVLITHHLQLANCGSYVCKL